MALIGNIGVPVTDMYGRDPVDAYVVEVSSYQAAEVTARPRVCVLTSLAPDHLDWHRGEEAYYRDKLRLIEAGPERRHRRQRRKRRGGSTDRRPSRPDPVRPVRPGPGRRGGTVDGRRPADGATPTPGRSPGSTTRGTCAAPSPAPCCSPSKVRRRLPSVARCRGVRGPAVPVPDGRRSGGVTFVDDALASNPFATVASVDAFPDRPLTVILGGADRGVDPGGLVEALADRRPAPRVIVLAPDAQGLAEAFDPRRPSDRGSGRRSSCVPTSRPAVWRRPHRPRPAGWCCSAPAAPTSAAKGGYSERSRRFAAAAGLTGAVGPVGLTDRREHRQRWGQRQGRGRDDPDHRHRRFDAGCGGHGRLAGRGPI